MHRIMVACSGSQDKWKNYLGVPSHLVRDRFGEPLLWRTLRQLRERGYSAGNVFVFHPDDERYYLPGNISVVSRHPGQYETEFHTTQGWWQGGDDDRNTLLLGDTWFTNEAMDTVLGHEGNGIRFFGRTKPSRVVPGSKWGELFAYSWTGYQNARLRYVLQRLSDLRSRDKVWRFCGWEVLYYLQQQKIDPKSKRFRHQTNSDFFTEIDDMTDDIDFPEEYKKHPMFGGKK